MGMDLLQRWNGDGKMTRLQPSPIVHQRLLVQFSPSLNQALLPPGKLPREQFDGLDPEHPDLSLIVGVKMGRVMPSPDLDKHADDDAKEAAQFWHGQGMVPTQTNRIAQPLNFFATMVALWPPKPKELLTMALTVSSRATLGTQSRSHSGSGVS